MEEISGCGGGGWTLVMKIDGAKVEKVYKTARKISSFFSNLSVDDFIALIAKRHAFLIYYSSIQSKVF